MIVFIKKIIIIFLAVAIGLTVYFVSDPNAKIGETFSQVSPTPFILTKVPPTAVSIPKIGINLPISAATVNGNDWELFDDKVSWLATSAVPNEGNVILYAHDKWNLFGLLYKLVPGDIVNVEQNDKWVKYSVTESKSVLPSDLASVLSDENRLTLYTCNGIFDRRRLVVYAKID